MIQNAMLIVARMLNSNFVFRKFMEFFFFFAISFPRLVDSVCTESMDYNHTNCYMYNIYIYNTLFQDSIYK